MVLNNPEDKHDLLTYISLPDVVSYSTLDKKKHKQILLSWILPVNVFKYEQGEKKFLNYVFFTVDCV